MRSAMEKLHRILERKLYDESYEELEQKYIEAKLENEQLGYIVKSHENTIEQLKNRRYRNG